MAKSTYSGIERFIVRTSPVFGQGVGALIPLFGALIVSVAVSWLLWYWSGRQGWNDLHRLALASGAIIAHTSYDILDIAQTTTSHQGLAGLAVVMLALLILFAFLVRRRLHHGTDIPAESTDSDREHARDSASWAGTADARLDRSTDIP